jgi:hypothetical protein
MAGSMFPVRRAALVLVRVGLRERANGPVEGARDPEIGGDGDAVAGLRVGTDKRLRADAGVTTPELPRSGNFKRWRPYDTRARMITCVYA